MKTSKWRWPIAAALVCATATYAQDNASAVRAALQSKYPKTAVGEVRATPLPGVYEVAFGRNIVYSDKSGRYFFFGRLFDMQTQQDLTEPRLAAVDRIDVASLPLADAIKDVRGNGQRTLVVFSDPDCPYCRRLEEQIKDLTNVTVYTFLFPLDQIHPDARAKAIAVWCSNDKAAAWRALMLRGEKPAGAKDGCDHPLERISSLAARLGVQGTPTLFSGDGRRRNGGGTVADIEAFLSGERLAHNANAGAAK
ncbi:MAG TPA: DsbC family protein [Burkholderiaceae bacterium]|nr:DsbC family protein [Burkholderiaceae bacterium]